MMVHVYVMLASFIHKNLRRNDFDETQHVGSSFKWFKLYNIPQISPTTATPPASPDLLDYPLELLKKFYLGVIRLHLAARRLL